MLDSNSYDSCQSVLNGNRVHTHFTYEKKYCL